jgi:Flp pilus assembly protein TadB
MSVRSREFRRVSRRDRTRARSRKEKREKLKEFAYASARGAEWTVLFLGLMVSLVTALVAFLTGETMYAIVALLFGLLVGAALLKWESS